MYIKIITILILFYSCQKILSQESDTVYWSHERKLKVTDYNFTIADDCEEHHASAMTTSGIEPKVAWKDNFPYFNIRVYFLRSWSCATDTPTLLLLLGHEQLHFDIEELFGRKVRKGIEELKKSNEKDYYTYEALINRIIKEETVVQNRYDYETLRGNDEETQKIWAEKIGKELLELEEYASDRK